MKCFIYRNLHKPGHVYSLKALEGEHKGRVVGYASSLFIEDVQFVVRERGRQKVIETGYKNVHAGIVGNVTAAHGLQVRLPNPMMFEESYYNVSSSRPSITVKYNPYKGPTFYNAKTNEPVHTAGLVFVSGALIEAFVTALRDPAVPPYEAA